MPFFKACFRSGHISPLASSLDTNEKTCPYQPLPMYVAVSMIPNIYVTVEYTWPAAFVADEI